nr:hypothetical protein OG999_33415 [Streptomyces sp. NBC_00886]
MATVLYRLGRLAFRRRWYVTILWAVILAALGFASAKAAEAPATTFSTPGVESQRAFDPMAAPPAGPTPAQRRHRGRDPQQAAPGDGAHGRP